MFLIGLLVAPTLAKNQSPPSAEEQVLGEKDPGAPAFDAGDVASSDCRRVAWRARTGSRWHVVINGQADGLEGDNVSGLAFSPDGQHVAYALRREGLSVIVRDGKEQPLRYEAVGATSFSPDGQRLAYGGRRAGRWSVVVDGRESAASYDEVGAAVFSADGRHVAYHAKREKQWRLVVDDQEQAPAFDAVALLRFSAEGRRTAYIGRTDSVMKGARVAVVVDGQAGPSFGIVGGLQFSPDGRRVGYGAVQKIGRRNESRVVIDGKEGPLFDGGSFGAGSQLTGQVQLHLWPAAHSVSSPVFSRDGQHVAYVAHRAKNDAVVMMDDQAGPPFRSIVSPLAFSSDGQHLAYVAMEDDAAVVVVDSKRVGVPVRGTALAFPLVFAPDGTRVGFISHIGGFWHTAFENVRASRRAVVDGRPGAEYKALALNQLQFSPDSRHVAYEVIDADAHAYFIVLDGQEGPRYDFVFPSSSIFVDNALCYIAMKGHRFIRVAQRLPDREG